MTQHAVESGRPAIIARWWRSYAVAMAGLLVPAGANLLFDLKAGGPKRALLIVALAVQVGSIFWMVALLVRYIRIVRALRARPAPCFNCLYTLSDAQTRCPECGRTQNPGDLSPRWRERVRPGPPAG